MYRNQQLASDYLVKGYWNRTQKEDVLWGKDWLKIPPVSSYTVASGRLGRGRYSALRTKAENMKTSTDTG